MEQLAYFVLGACLTLILTRRVRLRLYAENAVMKDNLTVAKNLEDFMFCKRAIRTGPIPSLRKAQEMDASINEIEL